MSLEPATLEPWITNWSDAASSPWSAAEKTRIAEILIAIAEHVVPLRIDDVAIANDRWQAYLLSATLRAVQDRLIETAAELRRYYGIAAPRLTEDTHVPAIGLRGATVAELDTIPGIGAVRAEAIARFLTQHPDLRDLRALTAISGIGEETVEQIGSRAYIDRPSPKLLLGAVLDFAMTPIIPRFIKVLEETGGSFFYGDYTAYVRRSPAVGGSVVERFVGFLETVEDRTRLASVAVDGTPASEAEASIARGQFWEKKLREAHPAQGELLINENYAPRVKAALDTAQASIELMMFLTTDATGVGDALGPKDLLDALVAAHGRGVATRVVLDQDDDGYPYKSSLINAEVFRILRAAGVSVKWDERDRLLHSKLCVIDETVVFVGAHNWTRAGLFGIHDMSVALHSVGVAQRYRRRFDEVWNALPA